MPHNLLLRDLRLALEARFAEDFENMPMSVWMEKNTHLKKRPFSFSGYEFQRQIADDLHPNLSCMKCSQVGLTEIQLRKFLGFLYRTTAINGIFTLPTDVMFKRVSNTRAKPLIELEAVFTKSSIERPIRQVGLYQLDQSFAFFTGNKESDATSINADILFHDELDLSDEEMIGLFNSRLQGSALRIKQKFSTPTFVGYGIDGEFNVSDQHEYMVRCVHCNHHNIPDFTPDFVHIPGLSSDITDLSEIDYNMVELLDLPGAYVMCESCHEPLPMTDPSIKSWVPRYPSRTPRGYAIRPLATGRLDVPYIVGQLLEHKRKDSLRRWYNTTLGKAYNDSNARLSETQIRSVMRGSTRPEISSPIFVGIDVGLICHVVQIIVKPKPAVVRWDLVHSSVLPEYIRLLDDVVAGCMDRHPYTPLANEIMEISENKIVPVEYRGVSAMDLVTDEFGVLSHVKANRTGMLDTVASMIRKMAIEFTGYGQHEHLIIQHLQDMVRIENDESPAVWNKLTGNDHFFHALAFGLQAMKMKAVLDSQLEVEPREMVNCLGLDLFKSPIPLIGSSGGARRMNQNESFSRGKL